MFIGKQQILEIQTMLREQLPGLSSKKKQKLVAESNFYVLHKVVGQGTFGKVFEAEDTRTGSRVAIKEVFQDKRYKNRQLDVICRLDNANIIYMKDYYFINRKDDKYLYIVMDFYESNLQSIFKQRRKKKTPLDPQIRKILAFQLFKGLYYLQNNKVCHRDLKPPNILVDPQTHHLRICDFGSAKIFDKNQNNVAYICSRYYRAPELLFQYSKYQTQIDVWSAGCIMAQFVTLQPIFPGDSSIEQMIEIMKIIGTPSQEYLQKYAKNRQQQIKLPKIPKIGWHKLLRKYKPEPEFIDLISKILVFDIQQRLKPVQILLHPYFKDISQYKYQIFHQKVPHLLDFNQLRNPRNAKDILKLQETYIPKQPKQNLKQKVHIRTKTQKLETSDCTPQVRQEQKIDDRL